LRGQWEGYRSVRLSQAYRVIYIVKEDDTIETAFVEEVNKHDY
jgi:toxin HigB-1